MNYTSLILIIVIGILATTLIDAVGSVLSRRLNFRYSLLVPISLAAYTLVSYYATKHANLSFALIATFLVCMYDLFVGWKISLALKANMSLEDTAFKIDILAKTFIALLLTILFGALGYYLAQ